LKAPCVAKAVHMHILFSIANARYSASVLKFYGCAGLLTSQPRGAGCNEVMSVYFDTAWRKRACTLSAIEAPPA
jgi:hypothetical protein